jgi:glucosylceramidase
MKIMKMNYLLYLLFAFAGSACSKNSINNNTGNNNGGDDTTGVTKVDVWQTSGDKIRLLQKTATLSMKAGISNTGNLPQININTNETYQTIEGFGAALTWSSAYVLNHNLPADARTQLLNDLFTKNGIGIGYIRLTIGASDFSPGDYSYDDHPGDTLMQQFSLDKERTDLLPVLKEVVSVNPNIKIVASPWSPPAWMKTSNSMEGGHLLEKYYDAYARYFVKYIQEMKTEGIMIDAITIQNEPLYGTAAYPCMFMYANEQKEFIRDHLGPLFKQNNINTKIILYDHNWDVPLYGDTILNDADAAQYVAGTAFHAYAGEVTAMGQLHNLHPDKDLFFTELSGGGWAPNFADNLKWFTENLTIGAARTWSKIVLLWNLALDENNGPKNNGCQDCRGVVTVASNGTVTKNEEYYILGHAGKFLQPGAKRCSSTDVGQDIHNVVFINPDNSKVLIAVNTSNTGKPVFVSENGKAFSTTLIPGDIYTFYWK